MSSTPWIEAYRPNNFDDIVLDSHNRSILTNVIESGYFPNLLFFGPPGTGKTTTIINLVNSYQIKYKQKNKELMIHLNASDERGIDIIRSQINQFVNSKTLFNKGMKFVILDEVDYMTKNAQQALRYLLQTYSENVRFCLICNYVSRIDEGLQNEFLRLRFNQLPQAEITRFLRNIAVAEQLQISDASLSLIQQSYNSDIRSMINFMQTTQNISEKDFNIINSSVWDSLLQLFKTSSDTNTLAREIIEIGNKYNMDKKQTIKEFLNYIIRFQRQLITPNYLNFVENVINADNINNAYYVNYCAIKLSSYIKNC